MCDFCAFLPPVDHVEAYVLRWRPSTRRSKRRWLSAEIRSCCRVVLHPKLPLEWYEDTLRALKAKFPQVNIHGFSPPEIYHFHKMTKLPLETVLQAA